MRTSIKNLFLLPGLVGALSLMLVDGATAQAFTTLHSFAVAAPFPGPYTNGEGANPTAGLILSNNSLYGTAGSGGTSGNGTVFVVKTDGTGFRTLHSFSATFGLRYQPVINSDGANPNGSVSLFGNTLYGTTSQGGNGGNGAVFAINADGTGFTNLYSFTAIPSFLQTNSDGANPHSGLIFASDTLYGTARAGGTSGAGTVFKLNTDGTGFTTLHSFTATSINANSDGASPEAGLILTSNTLYGTARSGGSSGAGTVFKLNTDGTGFTILHSFAGYPNEGAHPYAGLILSSNTLYGTTFEGGSWDFGTVFAVNTDGTGFETLNSLFDNGFIAVHPYAGLLLKGNTLYGTASEGTSGEGVVFAMRTDGTGFKEVYSFTLASAPNPPTNADGAHPYAGLLSSSRRLYGTTYDGGSSGYGTVFSLSFVPQLTIIPSAANIILTWPTNYAGFDYTGYTLQFSTNLVSQVWTTNSATSVVVNGQNTVTNPIPGTQQFFRLRE